MDMSEEDAWEGLEAAYRDGLVDHVPGIGSGVDPAFTLNEDGEQEAKELLRENDAAVLQVLALVLNDYDEPAEGIASMGKLLRDEVGVNVFRVMRRHPDACPGIDVEGLPDRLVEEFDPEGGDG